MSQIKGALKYLVSNKETFDEEQAKFIRIFEAEKNLENEMSPVHKLQRMSMAELTYAYDFLLKILH